MFAPKRSQEIALKRIGQYLVGTADKGIILDPKNATSLHIDAYPDADFAGLYKYEDEKDPVCVKSRTGYFVQLGGCPLAWVSKLQREIALSTLEAEYIALSTAMRDLLPMRELLKEVMSNMKLNHNQTTTINSTVFEDNNGAISLALSPNISPKTRHIAIKYHFFRSKLVS